MQFDVLAHGQWVAQSQALASRAGTGAGGALGCRWTGCGEGDGPLGAVGHGQRESTILMSPRFSTVDSTGDKRIMSRATLNTADAWRLQGKSELMAAIGLYLLIFDGEWSTEAIGAASDNCGPVRSRLRRTAGPTCPRTGCTSPHRRWGRRFRPCARARFPRPSRRYLAATVPAGMASSSIRTW